MAVAVGAKVMVSDAEVRRLYEEQFKKAAAPRCTCGPKDAFPPGATEAQKEEIKKKAETIVNSGKTGCIFLRRWPAKFSLKASDVGFVSQGDLDPRLAEFLGN